MNAHRKIQLSAAAVIANGALALSLLSPGPASASSCGSKNIGCQIESPCSAAGFQLCPHFAPPGCTYFGAQCVPCSFGLDVTCFYH
jgi:hypothetical protein